jgi:predicted metal-dependent hydrolase
MARFEPRPLEPDNVRPRRTSFSFSQSIPKHWLAGNAVQTHFFNAINLFVVSFEDFMGRVMRGRLQYLKDPAFERQIRGFMGQEATHAYVHA